MNDTMSITKTSVWGVWYNVRDTVKRDRLMKKNQLLTKGSHPFIDHYKIYAYKPKNQKGPAKEEQTFIVSYAYNYDSIADELAFINRLNEIGLLFYKEKCLYKTHNAYKIIIYENACSIDAIAHYFAGKCEN